MKNNWKILLVLPLFLVLGGCINSTNNVEETRASDLKDKTTSASISIAENNFDLGEIPIKGGKVDIVFAFTNDGDEPVLINAGQTSCMCTTAVIKNSSGDISARMKMPGHGPLPVITEVIEPGEKAELIATYDPMAHGPGGVGAIKRDIVLKTNSTATPEIKFSFQGVVVN